MSGSIDFGGRVVFDGDDQCIVTTDELERQRLEREVIETAKAWHEMRLMQAGTSLSRKVLMQAVAALLEFESKQDHK